jgi:hypothetical protein
MLDDALRRVSEQEGKLLEREGILRLEEERRMQSIEALRVSLTRDLEQARSRIEAELLSER